MHPPQKQNIIVIYNKAVSEENANGFTAIPKEIKTENLRCRLAKLPVFWSSENAILAQD